MVLRIGCIILEKVLGDVLRFGKNKERRVDLGRQEGLHQLRLDLAVPSHNVTMARPMAPPVIRN